MSQVFHEVKPLCSWYHSNFGISTANQLIMLCVQATMMMLLPELWIFMLWPPMLLHLIYQSVDIASTAVDNCCIHLLWIYAASNCCEYTATTAVVHPKPSLWYFVFKTFILLLFYMHLFDSKIVTQQYHIKYRKV